ncbi:uncharacterized protein LOC135330907 [Halichondria panicea]|uniref:uncharacterized protein LOC135330907 n=1 Tax=Halichondria panicea TaxID=6063 RepID=UPI00312B3A8C
MSLTRHEALEVLGLGDESTDQDIKDRFKQLALKWHPDKNPEDPKAAEEKFQKLSAAYSHLKHEDKEDEDTYDAVSLAELLIELFGRRRFMFEPTPSPSCTCFYCTLNSEWKQDRQEMMEEEKKKEYIRDYHEATAKVIGDHLVKQFADKLYNNFNQPSRMNRKGSDTAQVKVSSEEASRNAKQLLEAEEKEERDKEKKRERNKKKKEAKKKRKASAAKATKNDSAAVQDEDSGPEEPEGGADDEFDVTSAFIARASKKQSSTVNTKPRPPRDASPFTSNGTVSSTSLQSNEGAEQSLPLIRDPETMENDLAQSRKLASLGNRAAKDGHFGEAVRRYTEAIALYPYDHRYFGNRSFCYDFLQNYTSALEDANRAIALDVTWAKGYYRRGRAYAGLKRLELSEGSYIQALKCDPQYKDAEDELFKIRVEQLVGMGFPPELCEPAVKEFGSVQSSIEAILAGKVVATSTVANGYHPDPPPSDPPQSKQSRERYKLPPRMQVRASQPQPPPSPPRKEKSSGGLEKRSLWVGNITSDDITEEMMSDLFKPFGEIVSVRLLPARRCAFVNFLKVSSAAKALEKLQGYHLGGNYLLLRYPEMSNKNPYMLNLKKPGPVNGTECYYWRTTGCQFGIQCRYEHLPENKGVDLPTMV